MTSTCGNRVGLGDGGERDGQSKRVEKVYSHEPAAWINNTITTGCSAFPQAHASEMPKEYIRC